MKAVLPEYVKIEDESTKFLTRILSYGNKHDRRGNRTPSLALCEINNSSASDCICTMLTCIRASSA